jgi:hypothetical protein
LREIKSAENNQVKYEIARNLNAEIAKNCAKRAKRDRRETSLHSVNQIRGEILIICEIRWICGKHLSGFAALREIKSAENNQVKYEIARNFNAEDTKVFRKAR